MGVFLGRHKRPKCRHAQEKTGWGFKSRRRGETSSLSQDSPKTKGKAMLGLKIKTYANKNTKACQPCQQALYYIQGSQKMINTQDGQEPRIGAIIF